MRVYTHMRGPNMDIIIKKRYMSYYSNNDSNMDMTI